MKMNRATALITLTMLALVLAKVHPYIGVHGGR
jgi:hypothetical protein